MAGHQQAGKVRSAAAHLLHDAARKARPCLLHHGCAHKLAPGIRLGGIRGDAQRGCWGGGRCLAAPSHRWRSRCLGSLGPLPALQCRQQESHGHHGQQRQRQIAYQRSARFWRAGCMGSGNCMLGRSTTNRLDDKSSVRSSATAGGWLVAGGWRGGSSNRSCKQQAACHLLQAFQLLPHLSAGQQGPQLRGVPAARRRGCPGQPIGRATLNTHDPCQQASWRRPADVRTLSSRSCESKAGQGTDQTSLRRTYQRLSLDHAACKCKGGARSTSGVMQKNDQLPAVRHTPSCRRPSACTLTEFSIAPLSCLRCFS